MDTLLGALQRFMEQDNWPVEVVADRAALRTVFAGANGQWTCYGQTLEELRQAVFYSQCPANASPERRVSVAEYLTRANYGLVMGNFEMDFDDGAIRFKTSVDVSEGELTQALARNLLYTNVLMMDRYLPGIMLVNYAGQSPVEALSHSEPSVPASEVEEAIETESPPE